MTSPPAHPKATRGDWVDAALTAIEDMAIDEIRILTLAERLSISRSSFYWYFEDLDELHSELLAIWESNTSSIVERASRPAATINAACLGVFECWVDSRLYDVNLDLAVRDWGRRDTDVAERVFRADQRRLAAISAMFERFGFDPDACTVRARLLYHSQVGYYTVNTDEPFEVKMMYLPYYLEAMTGTAPTKAELDAFEAFFDMVHNPGNGDG